MGAESLYVAQLMLTFQAVGIGEAHDDPRGRQKILDWIERDWVAHLVLELPSFADAMHTRHVDAKWHNRIPLSQLIETAEANDVAIHKWDDWHEFGTHPASERGMENRNRLIAESFGKQFGKVTDAHHCVILFGAKHFPAPGGFEALLPGLKWANLGLSSANIQ